MTASFHKGEVALQNLVLGEEVAQMHRGEIKHYIRKYMPDQHKAFYEDAPWLAVGTVDSDGQPWGHVLQERDGRRLKAQGGEGFILPREMFMTHDVALDNLQNKGAKLGLLGLEMHTRRRNRVNGSLQSKLDDENQLLFKVDQSFGNCPKYIQSRRMKRVPPQTTTRTTTAGISEAAAAHLRKADTFFIASCNPGSGEAGSDVGVDLSHRGGTPGFIDVNGDIMKFPDYAGNRFFQTLGNIAVNPKVGILAIDYETCTVYQLSGEATLNMNDTSMHGSERSVSIKITNTTTTEGGLLFTYHSLERSPFNPSGGTEGASLRLVSVKDETHDVKTFTLRAAEKVRIDPGQYGSFIVEQPRHPKLIRAWTVSSTHANEEGTQEFDITVKNKHGGAVSPWMHYEFSEGDVGSGSMRLAGVEGTFTLPKTIPENASFVFAAAGSGITPVMSILRVLSRHPSKPTATLFYSVKTLRDVIFHKQLSALPNVNLHISLTAVSEAVAHPFRSGRLTASHIASLLPPSSHTAYICGPSTFAKALENAFTPDKVGRVITESFDY
eukprot:TRINITY_DN1437_c3_g1_i1.p1 TRINITY_DN1437_c3_g1~~TRINITY_DN1437_c3_g1_i1.p1  ORF type:complete len:567 (+),score=134.94 TRINITY_DN1437_c3_g1_i1:43-1701(+)